jgi:hypothetical protein
LSNIYAEIPIKIYVDSGEIDKPQRQNYYFYGYYKNGECEYKDLPFGLAGIIPVYEYNVGDIETFKKTHAKSCTDLGRLGECRYNIKVKIPFAF